jgi:hypothetical protein
MLLCNEVLKMPQVHQVKIAELKGK